MEALQHNFLLRGFFEKRGYSDASELSKHSIAHLPKGQRSKTFAYDADKLFDKPDNAKLKDKKKLDDAGKFLEGNSFGLAVVASSEAKGDTENDLVLSEARAAVVWNYLTQNFKVDDKRIRTIGLGRTVDNGESDSSKIYIYVYPRTGQPRAQRTSQPNS
jgi:outer membrane protein OmpA-like peptidoglycan-associated protein